MVARGSRRSSVQAFAFDGGAWIAPILGWAVERDGTLRELDPAHTPWPEAGDCLRALPAAWRRPVLLSLAFAEDFAILDGSDATIPWLAVALPSHWAPEHKVGRPFAEAHAPVADSQLITGAASHLARLVTGTDRWERFVWTIVGHPRLHAHPDRVDPSPWPVHLEGDALAAQAWWRTEHQTFIPVEGHVQAVFTIHAEVRPLRSALDDPERRQRVHDALASMSHAVLEYRGLAPVRDRLLRWLSGR
jgi:dimethylamine monooxygenase subunit A